PTSLHTLSLHDALPILKSIPDNYQLQLSNSSTIRYTQLFNINPTLKVFCNRGTSGIDGSTSTAVGASLVSEKPTLLITGDLGFRSEEHTSELQSRENLV